MILTPSSGFISGRGRTVLSVPSNYPTSQVPNVIPRQLSDAGTEVDECSRRGMNMHSFPREVRNPHRRIPLEIPEGVTATEFFNSPCNLRHLSRENGLLRTKEGFLLYRKAIGHSNLFDTSIILDTSQTILDPLGRPVRRDQLDRREKIGVQPDDPGCL